MVEDLHKPICRRPGVGVEGSQAIKDHLRNQVVFLYAQTGNFRFAELLWQEANPALSTGKGIRIARGVPANGAKLKEAIESERHIA